jgi:hypothetical protein
MKSFNRGTVHFQYPANWTIEREEGGSGWTATVQSPGTAFAVLTLQPDADSPFALAEETLAAFKAEYPGLETDEAVESIAGFPAVGHDIEFLTLDTTTSAFTRCLDTEEGPLLLMAQTGGYDRAEHWPLLLAIKESLRIDTDEA